MRVSADPVSRPATVDAGTLAGLRSSLLALPLRVGPNYLYRDGDVYMTSVEEYFSRQDWFKKRRLTCPEFPVEDPDEAMTKALFAASGATGTDGVLLLHAGYAGSASPIHFDWDFRRVLHLNLSGSKRLAIGHPDLGVRSPIVINSLPYDLAGLSRAEQGRLFRWLGAHRYKLGPGDGVIFPPLWWHAACYDRACLSLSFRFDEVSALRPIAALPRSGRLQRLVWLLISSAGDDDRIAAVDEIVRAFFRVAHAWRGRYRAFMADLLRIEARLRSKLDVEPPIEVIPEHLNAERHVARREIEDAYGWSPGTVVEAEAEQIDRVARYLFAGSPSSALGLGERLDLALYAIAKRQGLPPVRGVVLRDGRHL